MRLLPVPRRRYLGETGRRQVEALFEAILPGTPTSPGARDVGAAHFLDGLLAVDGHELHEVPAWRHLYAAALPALDRVARDRFDRPLADLDVAQATELLRDLEAGRLGGGLPAGVDPRQLFATLRDHCIEGCLADPRWGGNRNRVAWRWLGYAAPAEDFQRGPDGTLLPASSNVARMERARAHRHRGPQGHHHGHDH
jgi:gluconate 2-dehydrogenase gamma chain